GGLAAASGSPDCVRRDAGTPPRLPAAGGGARTRRPRATCRARVARLWEGRGTRGRPRRGPSMSAGAGGAVAPGRVAERLAAALARRVVAAEAQQLGTFAAQLLARAQGYVAKVADE